MCKYNQTLGHYWKFYTFSHSLLIHRVVTATITLFLVICLGDMFLVICHIKIFILSYARGKTPRYTATSALPPIMPFLTNPVQCFAMCAVKTFSNQPNFKCSLSNSSTTVSTALAKSYLLQNIHASLNYPLELELHFTL